MLKSTLLAFTAAVGLLAATGAQAAAPDEATVSGGALKGVVQDGVVAFKGVPYAAAPTGALRWRPPQPAAKWSGVRDASQYGHACPTGADGYGAPADQDEDCLVANVWAPADHAGKKLPVMVWIHGGGFVGGSANARFYDGTSFARDGVVLISVNYRLGRLGYFAHPALMKESGAHGNYGMMDQMAALKWARANAAAFGGDPRNVTVFGESAGGISINNIMISPEGRGLFDKAIAESSFGRFDSPTIAEMAKAGAAYAAANGVTGDGAEAAAALRALPAKEMLKPASGLDAADAPRPMIDGKLIVERTDDAFAKGHQVKVPYMIGGNSFEASLFARGILANPPAWWTRTGMDPAKAVPLFGPEPNVALINVATANLITEPDRDLARLDAKAGVPTWRYYFAYVAEGSRGPMMPGAGHGSELGFVFQTLPRQSATVGGRTIAAATASDLKVSDAIHAYWVNFAKTGMPGAAGGVEWPRFDAASDPVLQFGADGQVSVVRNLQQARLDAIEAQAKANGH